MKSSTRIYTRFIAITVAISLLLLIFNAFLLCVWTFSHHESGNPKSLIKEIDKNLELSDGHYRLSPTIKQKLNNSHAWIMLLDDNGYVIWSENLPSDIPMSYTASDIAGFSRWYLKDYPVYVWKYSDGLLVLGYPKDSTWKYPISLPMTVMDSMIFWVPGALILNTLLAIILSILISFKLIKSIKPLLQGIFDMSNGKKVKLKETGLFRDISVSINHTSDTLQRKNEALQKQDVARSNWIAGISHDIRTPLSMILGYASELGEADDTSNDVREQTEIMQRQCIKLRDLVNDLNLVSLLEYDMQPLNIQLLQPAVIIRQVVTELINNSLEERFQIEVNIIEEFLTVNADKRLLYRAISNLLQNCINHNSQGCNIVIELARNHLKNKCLITICDDGNGISSNILESLTKLPYANTQKIYKEHGLGLPMVAKIVEAHNGKFSLSSDIGNGFKALIELPLANI